MKKLPHKLEPGNVQKLRHVHTTNNLLSKPEQVYRPLAAKKYFNHLEYICTDYHKHDDLEKGAFEVEKIKAESYNRKLGFTVSSRIKHKSEDIFEDLNYQYPTMGPATGIIGLQSIVRSDFNDMPKFSCGKSRTNSVGKRIASDHELIEWANKIFTLLSDDWASLKFKVKITKTEELLILFDYDPENISSELRGPAVGKYMNYLAKHGLAAELGLRKRGDRWGRVEDVEKPKKAQRAAVLLTPKKRLSPSSSPVRPVSPLAAVRKMSPLPRSPMPAYSNDRKQIAFSFYPPWVPMGTINAMRAAAHADRRAARGESLPLKVKIDANATSQREFGDRAVSPNDMKSSNSLPALSRPRLQVDPRAGSLDAPSQRSPGDRKHRDIANVGIQMYMSN